jgi:hypothetical protein
MTISSSSVFILEPCLICDREVKISTWPGGGLYLIRHSCAAVEYSGEAVRDGKLETIVNHWNGIMIAARNRVLESLKKDD